jgi:hypothetical protein
MTQNPPPYHTLRFTMPLRPVLADRTAFRLAQVTRGAHPVCDGCHAHTSHDGWFPADDGTQYCAACSRMAAAG